MNELEKEKLKLEDVLEKYKEVIEDLELRIEFLPGKYRDNPYLLEDFLKMYSNKLELMKKSKEKPYFARIDFKIDGEDNTNECYLGKVGVINEDNETITVDWRAPIASVYYDSNVGRASYEAPEGIIKGELLLKRQYDIEKGELLDFRDVDTVSNDEILKPYLISNADNILKNIVASIQSEQNDIIREKMYKNLIVQGVAGSGKTTVALHRVAYLVYNYMNKVKPDEYLVIGPNKFFVNYISGVLPDLDVNNVAQMTYDEIVKDLIQEDINLLSSEDKLIESINDQNKMFFERLRTSNLYKKSLDKYLNYLNEKAVPNKDFIIKGYTILPRNIIKETFDSTNDELLDYSIMNKKIERTSLLIGKYIENNKDNILDNITKQYNEKTKSLDRVSIQKERKKIEEIKKELDNKCNQTLKKYFKLQSSKISNLYIDFLKNIDDYVKVDEFDLRKSAKNTIENIKNKKVEFEDLAALMYLKYRISGSNEYEKYKHIVIDEAQDFGEFNFEALKKLLSNATFSIFGDLSQSIYQYRCIDNWEQIIDDTFKNKCDIKYLLKSYRTTAEIMNQANNVIEHLGLEKAKPVIRHGDEVEYIEIDNNQLDIIENYLSKFKEKGYNSIAIISKTQEESHEINKKLRERGIDVRDVTDSNTEYEGGICTMPCYLAKGLEFDSVIITDASENKYNSNKSIDMKLLYVAMTRALHDLTILHDGKLTSPLRNEIKLDSEEEIKTKVR